VIGEIQTDTHMVLPSHCPDAQRAGGGRRVRPGAQIRAQPQDRERTPPLIISLAEGGIVFNL